MSRAFVREDAFEEAQAEALRRQQNTATLLRPMTRRGYDRLRERLAAAGAAGDAALAEALSARLRAASPVDVKPDEAAGFGATLDVREQGGRRRRVRIVGDDETDLVEDAIALRSPLAQALLGAVAGDVVTWPRPAGDIEVEVLAVRYEG